MARFVSIEEFGKSYNPPRSRNAMYQAIRRGLISPDHIRREGRRLWIDMAALGAADAPKINDFKKACSRCGMARPIAGPWGCDDHASTKECIAERAKEVAALKGLIEQVCAPGVPALVYGEMDYGVVWLNGKAMDPRAAITSECTGKASSFRTLEEPRHVEQIPVTGRRYLGSSPLEPKKK